MTPELLAQARAERNLYRDPNSTPNNIGDTAKMERIDLTDMQNRNYVASVKHRDEKERVVPVGPVLALILVIAIIVGIFATGLLKPPDLSEMEMPQIPFIGAADDKDGSNGSSDDKDSKDKQDQESKKWDSLEKPDVKKSISKYTWKELSQISLLMTFSDSASSAKTIAKKYNLMNKKGKLTDKTRTIALTNGQKVKVRLAGIYHDVDSDGEKIGLTFISTAPVAKKAINKTATTKGGWKKSDIRSYLNGSLYKKLPDSLSKYVIPAKKKTNNKGGISKLSDVSSSSDKLWLLSFTELCGKISKKTTWYESNDLPNYKMYNAEGKQYQRFKDAGIKMDDPNGTKLRCYFNGKSVDWWLRTPHPNTGKTWHIVTTEVDQTNCADANKRAGVVFGFCV